MSFGIFLYWSWFRESHFEDWLLNVENREKHLIWYADFDFIVNLNSVKLKEQTTRYEIKSNI